MGVAKSPGLAAVSVIGIDGHDGTGKTTIAKSVAAQLGMSYVRPFGGRQGRDLSRAHESGDTEEVLRIGATALEQAIAAAKVPGTAEVPGALILDRSWLTVASLMNDSIFHARWKLWIPTILCWADLPTTLARLAQRDEAKESLGTHRYYIDRYKSIAETNGCPIVDTSHASEAESAAEMVLAVRELLNSTGMNSTGMNSTAR